MPYKSKEDQAAAARKHYEANKEVMKARAIAHNIKVKQEVLMLVAKAKDVPCVDCGKKFIPFAMDFDHVRGKKEFNIGDAIRKRYSVSRVQKEIDKCEIVCAVCHRIRTYNRLVAE